MAYPTNYPQWAMNAVNNKDAGAPTPAFMDSTSPFFDANWMNQVKEFRLDPFVMGSTANVHVRLYDQSASTPITTPITLARILQETGSVLTS